MVLVMGITDENRYFSGVLELFLELTCMRGKVVIELCDKGVTFLHFHLANFARGCFD